MKYLFSSLSFFLFTTIVFAQNNFDVNQLRNDVEYLASDDLEGRETGKSGEDKAAEYIIKRFEALGVEPLGEEGFFQTFSFKPKPHPHASEKEMEAVEPVMGKNVIGFINNGAENTIVIGAHYDHLGEGTKLEGSLYAGKEPMVHNGADDNASGVAVMLALAEKLRSREDLNNNNYLFIGFSGEEKGLFGSNYFTKHPTVEIESINYMINMDMVGRFDEAKGLAINGTGTSPVWDDRIEKVNKTGIKIISDEGGIGPSDHTSFYLQNIPVLHFFTGQHEDYHKPTDDVEKVNFEGMAVVGDFILNLISSLNWEGKLAFTKTQQKDSQKAPKFSVTLGVMPDYMFDGEGMRIDGIIDDRPAQKAGLQKGDVVTKMGDVNVEGMRGYMEALSKFQKGDKAKIEVIREGKKETFTVQF